MVYGMKYIYHRPREKQVRGERSEGRVSGQAGSLQRRKQENQLPHAILALKTRKLKVLMAICMNCNNKGSSSQRDMLR